MSQLGDLQLDVMNVIWERGSATVAEVHDVLRAHREIAYTTVLSTLRNLEKRGFLNHSVEGKAHRFHACVTRDEFTRSSVEQLVSRLFAGEPAQLMSHLLDNEKLDGSDLERIKRLIDEGGEEASR